MTDGGGGGIPYIGAAIVCVGCGVAEVDALGDAASSIADALAETVGSGFGGPPYIVIATSRRQSASAAGATATSAKSAARDEREIERSRTAMMSAPQNGHGAPTRT